jgi:hypothetical protein
MWWRRRRAPDVRAEVLDFWRGRFALLGEKLAKSPDAGEAWFWRIEWNILNYLLHRYGGDEKQQRRAAAAKSEEKEAADASETPRHVALGVMPSGSFARMSGEGKKPRASREIGPLLGNISLRNLDRYNWLRQLQLEEFHRKRKEAAEGQAEAYRIVFEAYVRFVDPNARRAEPSPREIRRMLKEIMQWDLDLKELDEVCRDFADRPPEV